MTVHVECRKQKHFFTLCYVNENIVFFFSKPSSKNILHPPKQGWSWSRLTKFQQSSLHTSAWYKISVKWSKCVDSYTINHLQIRRRIVFELPQVKWSPYKTSSTRGLWWGRECNNLGAKRAISNGCLLRHDTNSSLLILPSLSTSNKLKSPRICTITYFSVKTSAFFLFFLFFFLDRKNLNIHTIQQNQLYCHFCRQIKI